jgi:hypothetical protein
MVSYTCTLADDMTRSFSTQASKVELEKLKLSEMTCEQAVKEVARIIYAVHDDVKDKDFELELRYALLTSVVHTL